MTSQDEIELRGLSGHRFPDHVARAGATAQPSPQISTTKQTSGHAESGSVRPSSTMISVYNHSIQDTSEFASSSSDSLPLMSPRVTESPGQKIVRRETGEQRATVPWPLRPGPLLGLVTYLIGLITALEVLRFLSDRNQGLVTAREDASYLWKYLPTAILMILAIYWNKLDYHTKAFMPWKLMSEKVHSVDQSLFLDYISGNLLTALSGSIRRRHMPVVISTIGSLTIILVTVLSTGLFVLQSTSIHKSTTVSVSSTFDGAQFNTSAVDVFPVLATSSILSGNLSMQYLPNTNADYAVDSFSLKTILEGPGASKSGLVEVFHADLDCKIGFVNSTSATTSVYNWIITADVMDDDCATGPTLIATPELNASGDRKLMPVGKVILKQCPGVDYPKLFVFFGQVDASAPLIHNTRSRHTIIHSFSTTALVCTPSHTLQEALVTIDSAGALMNVEIQKTMDKNIASPWDLWSAFNTSLQAAAPTLLDGPIVREYTHGSYSYDGFFAVLLASLSQRAADYLDPEVLMRDSQRLYTTTAGQIANRFLRVNSTRTAVGSYRTTQLRVTLRGYALRITEDGLAMLIMCACLFLIFPPFLSTSCSGTTLASLAVLMHRSDRLKSFSFEEPSLDHDGNSLPEQSFSIGSHKPGESISIQRSGSEVALSPRAIPGQGRTPWWRPMAFSLYMQVTMITLPLTIFACLEVTYQISCKTSGLDDAPSDQYWHYAWTWIPASVMTIVGLLYSSLTWSVALLDPYSILRTSGIPVQQALYQVNLSKAPVQLTYRAIRLKRYALLAIGVSALLAPLLTIVVSGLIFAQPVQRTENIVVPLADHISSPVGRYPGLAAWSQASLWAANLLFQGYGSHPQGTYKNFVFPNIEQQAGNATSPFGAKLLNASSVHVNADVLMSNTSCRMMDPAGFRYTVGLNGSNDPDETDSKGRWYGGRPGNSWLNFTHTELAVYKCARPGPHCDTGLVSFGVELQSDSTRFSYQEYAESLSNELWADPSAWPDGDALRQAVTSRNENPHASPPFTCFYGTWHDNTAHISGITCDHDIRQGRANVSYDLSTQTVTSVQPCQEEFVALKNFDQATPWYGILPGRLDQLLPNGDLWQTALNDTPAETYDTPIGSVQLATQISDLYDHFFIQFYNTALRDQNFTAGSTHANATLYDDNFQRIFQSPVSTRILEGLLLTMWVCACIVYWFFDTKTLLPENPCSIAAQASLLADSKFLDMIPEEAANATLEELMQMTPFKDHLFSMGWWNDGMGGRRFGIDIGMADFDRGEVEGEKVEESGEAIGGSRDV